MEVCFFCFTWRFLIVLTPFTMLVFFRAISSKTGSIEAQTDCNDNQGAVYNDRERDQFISPEKKRSNLGVIILPLVLILFVLVLLLLLLLHLQQSMKKLPVGHNGKASRGL